MKCDYCVGEINSFEAPYIFFDSQVMEWYSFCSFECVTAYILSLVIKTLTNNENT